MPSRLKRSEILSAGLARGGHPGLTTQAGAALDRFLEHLYRSNDWEFLVNSGSISSGANLWEMSLASLSPDYLNIKRVLITTDNIGRIQQEPRYEGVWDRITMDNLAGATGVPDSYAVSPDKTKLVVYPVPSKSYSASILYYGLPDDPAADGYPDWPDAEGLLMFVEAFARRWRLDSPWQIIQSMADQAINRVKASIGDRGRDEPLRIQFGRQFPKVWNR